MPAHRARAAVVEAGAASRCPASVRFRFPSRFRDSAWCGRQGSALEDEIEKVVSACPERRCAARLILGAEARVGDECRIEAVLAAGAQLCGVSAVYDDELRRALEQPVDEARAIERDGRRGELAR